MAFDFPANPTNGLEYTPAGGPTYVWHAPTWTVKTVPDTGGGGGGGETDPNAGQGNVGRNLIHNSMFNVAQRGAGPWVNTSGHTADRWFAVVSGDTASFTVSAVNDTTRAAIGDEAALLCLSNTFTGSASAAFCTFVDHRIESVRRLSGRTVTVSFWAAASSALNLGVSLVQSFGTGGSPSADVNNPTTGNAISLTATWTRYSTTITLPSTAGKSLGTSNSDYTALRLWYSSGTTNNGSAGNIGAQSGTIQLWGVQLEVGTVATPLEKPDPELQLRQCLRFYQVGNTNFNVYAGSGNIILTQQQFSQAMRAIPAITLVTKTYTNMTAMTPVGITNLGFTGRGPAIVAGLSGWTISYTASADL